jgi:DNA primase
MQNGRGKTVAAPHVVRAVGNAPASCPLRWSEVSLKLNPKTFTIRTTRKRLDSRGDLFAPASAMAKGRRDFEGLSVANGLRVFPR